MNRRIRLAFGAVAAAVIGTATVTPAAAAEFWLRADEVQKTVNTGAGTSVAVTMWQYRSCAANFAAPCASLGGNGGVIRVPAGDAQLIVHLQNRLRRGAGAGVPIVLPDVTAYDGAAVPTSVLIPALPAPGFAPGATAGSCPTGASAPVSSTDGRIRSFTAEVANVLAPGVSVGTYCWSNLRPGTFVYHSGTHPALQVQMGLYGALVVDGAAGSCSGSRCAYPGVAYDREVVAVFSEIDPRVHTQVQNGTYGSAVASPTNPEPMTSTIFYEPQYFFVDGEASDGVLPPVAFRSKANVAAGAANQRILLRLVNVGIENHVPLLNGERFRPVAQDGNPYPASSVHAQYSTLLAAGKTIDVLLTPAAAGRYALLDRRRALANNNGGAGGAAASGMLVNLDIAP